MKNAPIFTKLTQGMYLSIFELVPVVFFAKRASTRL